MRTMLHLWLALAAALALPATALAQAAPTVERITVHGASIEGNLEGNSADRTVFVVLPPSYAAQPRRRYPVVYFLHGFTATAEFYMRSAAILEGATAGFAGGREMIIVVPDTYTRQGGSMYSSSPTVGDFETFVARDLVHYVDGHYRTLARRESRGLAGHSMGGYGTLRIGMKHPQIFSSLYAMSACCLSPLTRTGEQAAALARVTPEQAAQADFFTRAMLASAAAWSPAPERAPFHIDTGAAAGGGLDPLVAARWAANSPLAMLPQYLPALRQMRAIALDVGDRDFLLPDDSAMHAELTRFGIAHRWTVYDGDHVNRVGERFRTEVLPFFQQHLAGE